MDKDIYMERLAEEPDILRDHISGLGMHLRNLFQSAEKDRQLKEGEWIKDLRQYKGKYDPEVLQRIHPKRSKAFLRMTRTKVRAVDARMMDLLFPANGVKNWSIEPTVNPDFDQETIMRVYERFAAETGEMPSGEILDQLLNKEAEIRCQGMAKEMEDQLDEIKYQDVMRKVIHSGNIYGTGILKGPLVESRKQTKWVMVEGGWEMVSRDKSRPFIEHVQLWDLYPDMSATDPKNMRYLFQRHLINKHALQKLANQEESGFDAQKIHDYIQAHPRGDANAKNHEQQLHEMSLEEGGFSKDMDCKYDLLEYWGYLDAEKLEEMEIEIPEEFAGGELAANVWILSNVVIKAVLSPIDGVDFPYFWYYFEKDETSIFGEGIPSVMRDPQKLFNASVRGMLDNAAISAGPIIEANVDLLEPNEDPTDIYPFRVFQRTGVGVESQYPAIRTYTLPSHTQEFLQMQETFSRYIDDATAIPRYMQGGTKGVQGAGRTASGLSMLMGSAVLAIKDQIRFFDNGITKPFIKALYHWNMLFNPKNEIKGDFEVNATGSASMIAKEVRSEKMMQFLQITANPMDAPLANRPYLLREVAKSLDLGEEAIKDDQILAQEQQQQQQIQEQIRGLQQAMDEQDAYIKQLEQRVRSQAIDELDEAGQQAHMQIVRNQAKELENS